MRSPTLLEILNSDSHRVPVMPWPPAQVTMSNVLARAAHGLNLPEKRVVALGLAGADSASLQALAQVAGRVWTMRVSGDAFAKTFHVHANTAYQQLKIASENLFMRYVRYIGVDNHGKPREQKFRWVSNVTYFPGMGYVELDITPQITPHLLGLREHFTTYQLDFAARLNSIYAWRLYELLKSWSDTGLYLATIEDFVAAMEPPESARNDFKTLRLRVIEPAVASIRAKGGMRVEWRPLRRGARKVTDIEFKFSPDPQGKLDVDMPLDNAEPLA